MTTLDLIRRKRDGGTLTPEEIDALVAGYTSGAIPDYQMSALLMAIVWRGLGEEETYALTRAMIDSGERLTYSGLGPTADKHSTGGVGDKVSLALAPLAAAAGVYVPMLSGRGLGHTGGTLDKLEAIPGFTTRLGSARFRSVLEEVGCVMGGQSAELAPADGKIYALRDTTATVESLPLIVSSILSKKIAAGPDALVLDVKVGRGAFMKTLEEARALATLLVKIGTRFGRRMLVVLTNMDTPLGRAIGNAIEVDEAMALLRGERVADDLREVTLVLTASMLVLAGIDPSLARARERLEKLLGNGEAYERFRRLVRAQGGDLDALEHGRLPRSKRVVAVASERAGTVTDIDPLALAHLVVDLGGGRRLVTDAIDPAVGVWLDAKLGEPVRVGERLLTLHLPGTAPDAASWIARALGAITVDGGPAESGSASRRPAILGLMGAGGSAPWAGWDTSLPL